MTVSPLANMALDMPAGDKWNPRQSAVSQVILHHNAGIDAYKYVVKSGREVSAHYWIGNSGEIVPQVDEDYRAWTSAMLGYPGGLAADHRSITFEISNSGGAPGWPISDAALESVARLIGDIFYRYNLGRVTRARVAVHRDYVPTECPGPYVMAHLDEIIEKAEAYRTSLNGDEMTPAQEKKLDRVLAILDRLPEQTAKETLAYRVKNTDGDENSLSISLREEPRRWAFVGRINKNTIRRWTWLRSVLDGKVAK